jgi:hypothetical protein
MTKRERNYIKRGKSVFWGFKIVEADAKYRKALLINFLILKAKKGLSKT